MEAVRIRANQAVPGMIVATDVYTPSNQLLVPKDTILDDRIITRMRFYGIYGIVVYINKEEEEKPQEESYIDMLRSTVEFKKFNRTYVETVNKIEESFQGVLDKQKGEINIDGLLEDTNRILGEGRNGAHILEMLHGIRDYDDLTFVHSMNVSLICSIFAGWLRMSPEDARLLTLAGLLHDIGKMLIPREILNKEGRLTPNEYAIVQQHSLLGYQAIKDLPIDIRVKHAILLHHERNDGSGYPNGFQGDQIDEFAKIVAIADVYDAMTSSRNYRKAICPFDVVENFEKDGFIKFDPKYLIVFMERIVESYLHTIVRLSDGREGEVVMINKLALSRPVIRIGEEFLDLSKHSKLTIECIV